MVKINYSKFRKSQKTIKTQEIKEIPKLEKHDVIFDIVHLNKLLKGNDYYNSVPNYLNKFFFKYGQDVFFDNGETFNLLSREEAKKLIPKNYIKQITINEGEKSKTKSIHLSEYFDNDLFLKTNESKLMIDYNKDYKFTGKEIIRGFEVEYNYLNMKKDLPRDYTKQIKITDEIKKGVEMFFNHIKEVLCSNIDTEYLVVKKFIASSVVGHKLKIALVIQTLTEQAGKGTVLNFLEDLLGQRMHKTSNPEEVMQYTKNFEGRTLINLDEVPVSNAFKTYSDSLKSLITEPKFNCREMRQQPYQQKNTFNIVLTSNNNCLSLTQSNNVRYYVPTCSNKYAGGNHKEYFNKLHKYLNDENVKIAIFQEFIKIYNEEVKPSNWTGVGEEMTNAKQIKVVEALPHIVKYIKNEYLLKFQGLDIPVKELELEYKLYNSKDNISSLTIGHYLSELNIECKRVMNSAFNGRKYVITFEKLKESFIKKQWLLPHELEELEVEKDEINKVVKNPLDEGIVDDNETILKNEINELKKRLQELEKENKELKEKQKPKKTFTLEELENKIKDEPKNKTKINKSTKESIKTEVKQEPIIDEDDDINIEDLEKFLTSNFKK